MKIPAYLFAITSLCILSATAQSQSSWSPEQSSLLASIHKLSASTAPDGAGADGYAAVLAENFSRWTTGSQVINRKTEWVEGVRGWFDDGWRVVDRNETIIEIKIRADEAFTRRIVEETYLGPNDERSVSRAARAETWVRSDRGWLLLRVNVDVLGSQ
jgi:hypothetical protein